jgi:hypothetical protein
MSDYHKRWALDRLRESRDGETMHHDNGRQIVHLAGQAETEVLAFHLDLTTGEKRYYKVTADGKREWLDKPKPPALGDKTVAQPKAKRVKVAAERGFWND